MTVLVHTKEERRRLVNAKLVAWIAAAFLLAVLAAPGGFNPARAVTNCVWNPVGTTKYLTGDCTTDATITIPNGFTLDGQGYTITAVDPAGGHFLGAVVASAGATAHVRNLGVTTSGLSNSCDAGANRLRGIMFDGASGSIKDNTVTDINQGQSGCQEGNGIEVRNAPFDGTHPATKSVTISGNTIVRGQKTGIVANGDVSVEVLDNSVAGWGPVAFIAENGIQLGFGAMGIVRGNSISGSFYTGCSNQDAAKTGCTPWVSAGLLLYDVRAEDVKHSNNRYRDNQFNMLLVNSARLAAGP